MRIIYINTARQKSIRGRNQLCNQESIVICLNAYKAYYTAVDSPIEEQRHRDRHQLGYREGQPHHVKISGQRHQIRDRQEYAELARGRYNHAVYAVAERLEHRANRYAEAGEDERQADYPQRGHADVDKVFRRVKEQQQLVRNYLHNHYANKHNGYSVDCRGANSLFHSVLSARAEVVRDYRHNSVV